EETRRDIDKVALTKSILAERRTITLLITCGLPRSLDEVPLPSLPRRPRPPSSPCLPLETPRSTSAGSPDVPRKSPWAAESACRRAGHRARLHIPVSRGRELRPAR